jgi:hypothetical protein
VSLPNWKRALTEDDSTPAAWNESSQAALITFLQSDLDVAFTMLESAKLVTHTNHREGAIQNVRAALTAIRQYEGRIQDRNAWRGIHSRADKLESALAEFSK